MAKPSDKRALGQQALLVSYCVVVRVEFRSSEKAESVLKC